MTAITPEQQEIGVTAVTPQGTPEILITPKTPGPGGAGPGGPGTTPEQEPTALHGALLPEDAVTAAPIAPPPDVDNGNGAESSLVELASRRRVGQARGWLSQNAPPPPAQPTSAAPVAPQPAPAVAEEERTEQPEQPEQTAAASAPPAEQTNNAGLTSRVLGDVARGVVETPTQVLGGIRDAIQSGMDLGEWISSRGPSFGDAVATAQLPDAILQKVAKGEPLVDDVEKTPRLPDVKAPQTVTGSLVRSTAQFLAGFYTGGKVMEGAKLGAAGVAAAKGAFSDFTAFEGQDQKLSDLVQAHPELQNPVTAFLSTKPGDGEAEGRFKRALEGLGLGIFTEGLFRAVKFLRDARRAANSAKAAGVHETPGAQPAAAPAAAARPNLLGDETGDLSQRKLPSQQELAAIVAKGKELAAKRPIVEAPMPSGANSSEDINGAVYVDPSVPEELRRPVAVHETVEQLLMPYGYKQAHIIATAAEKEAVEAAGMDWDKYTHEWDGLLANIENKYPRGTPMPGDLHVDPWAAIGHHAGKPEGLGAPTDVAAKGVAGAAADQKIIGRMAMNNPAAAAQAEAAGMTPLGDGEIAINFARIDTADDVKRVLQDAAEAFKPEIDAARRGVRSHDQTRMAALDTDAWQALMDRREGAPLNAEQTLAARNLWEASGRKLLDVAAAAAADPSPENLYAFRKLLAVHRTIQREVIAARTETGRALDAWRIDSRGGAQRLKAIQDLIDTFGGDGVSELMAKQVASLRNQPGRMGMLANFAERSVMAKTFGALREAYTNALLYAPTTHIKVALSNILNQTYDLVERAVAARWSQALGSGEVRVGEAAAKFIGQRQAMGDAWRLALRAFASGRSEFGNLMANEAPHLAARLRSAGAMKFHDFTHREISADNWKLASGGWSNPHNWLGNGVDALGAVVNFPGRMIAAVHDDFFKMIGYRGEVAARAFRRASEEIGRGIITKDQFAQRYNELINNPPDDIRLAAVDHALYLNFTDKPGEFVQWLNKTEAKLAASPHLGGQLGALSLRWILPFRGTPSRLFWAAIGRSPLAPLAHSYHEAIAAGGATADIARARMALGSVAMLTVLDYALDGHLTGSGPLSEGQTGRRQALYRAGWQPYAIRLPIGNGHDGKDGGQRYEYVSYNQLDPFGMHLGMAADIAEIINNSSMLDRDAAEDIATATAMGAFSFGHNILDKSWMTGLGQVADAFSNPQEESGRFVNQIGAAYVPNASRWARRVADPAVRDARSFTDEIKNRVPGLSKSLPAARDYWGRVRTYQSGMGEIYDALMPAPARTFNPEPIDKAILDNGINMPMPAHTLSFARAPGTSVYLRSHPGLYQRFLEIRGQMKPSEMPGPKARPVAALAGLRVRDMTGAELLIKRYGDVSLLDLLNGMVDGKNAELSPLYAKASGGPYGGKAALIRKIVSAYTRAAKGALLHEIPMLMAKVKADTQAREAAR
jgi:hypothetical protein